ncbi:hypothetical protein GCM10023149_15090 [Mucilaginibacter gynuensis]|uniref:Uncharacterized protein n=1 Tax=Mucilaginibacter gynuensis TaxID=1302236 RepID=A0ABP8G4T5_9SPHI
MKKCYIICFIIVWSNILFGQSLKENKDSQICYWQIEQEYVNDEIVKYLKENEISGSKAVAVIKIEYIKENEIRFYLTSIIYHSTLLKNMPSCYAIVKGEPILVYQPQKSYNVKECQTKIKKILRNKLIDDLNKKGKLKENLVPVSFDPSKYIIHFKDGNLLKKEHVGFVPE